LGNGGAGAQRFDAAAFSAAAARAVIVNADVAAFRGAPGASVVDATVENNSRSDAGAEGGVEDVAKSDACAPDGFSESGGVGVVVDFCAHVEDSLHFVSETKIMPARQVGRIQHDSTNGIERTGSANANSGERVAGLRLRGEYGVNRGFQGGKTRGGVFASGHGHARLVENCALRIDQASGDFR